MWIKPLVLIAFVIMAQTRVTCEEQLIWDVDSIGWSCGHVRGHVLVLWLMWKLLARCGQCCHRAGAPELYEEVSWASTGSKSVSSIPSSSLLEFLPWGSCMRPCLAFPPWWVVTHKPNKSFPPKVASEHSIDLSNRNQTRTVRVTKNSQAIIYKHCCIETTDELCDEERHAKQPPLCPLWTRWRHPLLVSLGSSCSLTACMSTCPYKPCQAL